MKIRLFPILFFLITLEGFSQNMDSSFQIQLINTLLDSAGLLIEKESSKEALNIIQKVEPLILPFLGPNSMEYARLSQTYGQYYENEGNFIKAEQHYSSAIITYNKFGDSLSLNIATTFNSLAGIYIDLGRDEDAEELYLKALFIREIKLGKDHPDYAGVLNNLAGIAQFKGEYAKAIDLFQQSIQIFEKAFGKESVKYARSLNNLGNVYFDTGEYNLAESFYNEALKIREKIFGRINPTCAASINCLGNLYSNMGLLEKALGYYLEALSIYEKTSGENNLSSAGCMTNIANIYTEWKKYNQAEEYFLKSKSIYLHNTGKEHPDYAMNLDNMANMYAAMEKYGKAEILYKEGLKIRENIFGIEHPEYANSLNNLGSFYSNIDRFSESELYLTKAKDVWKKIFGSEHPDYLLGLNNLNNIYWLTNKFDKLHISILESINLEQKLVLRASKHLSENELAIYIKTFSSNLDRLYSLQYISGKLSGICYDNALFYKGYLQNAVSNFNKMAIQDTLHFEKFNQLKQYHIKIANELSKPASERSSDNIQTLEENANKLEKELAGLVKGLSESRKNLNFQEVRNKLKPGEVAIEFIHFNYVNPRPTDSILYAALIIKPGIEEPLFVRLFEERELALLLSNTTDRRSEYVNSLYSLNIRGANVRSAFRKNLTELIWKPLSPNLLNVKTIFYSQTGMLHRINLDAIPINDSETIADKFSLVALNSSRQLALPIEIDVKNNKSVLFGGIQFDENQPVEGQIDLSIQAGTTTDTQSGSTSNELLNSWEFLPGTEKEVNAIDKIIRTNGAESILLSGINATEEEFKMLGLFGKHSPRNIHLATHGFFFLNNIISNTNKIPDENNSEPFYKASDNSMMRSGLILAKGNSAWQGKMSPDNKEDGILTAYEISQMNLSNTELVVLSACETGLGDIQGNEGVYGLQRAFKIAGAKYLIMSLWQVPDKQTSMLMITFYKKWLDEKMAIPDAFHAAQKELRDLGLDPYQWAGFVLVE
jgi:CHAT domain-containing protein